MRGAVSLIRTQLDTRADEQAIRGHVDSWLKLVIAKDAAGIAELYTEDGAMMPPNAPISKGRTAIRQTWASMMQTPGFDLTFVPEQIIVSSSGDMALDRGTYSHTFAPNGAKQTDTGKYVSGGRSAASGEPPRTSSTVTCQRAEVSQLRGAESFATDQSAISCGSPSGPWSECERR